SRIPCTATSRSATVDLPEPMPPVSPIRNLRAATRGVGRGRSGGAGAGSGLVVGDVGLELVVVVGVVGVEVLLVAEGGGLGLDLGDDVLGRQARGGGLTLVALAALQRLRQRGADRRGGVDVAGRGLL